jgi:hypothetical protein
MESEPVNSNGCSGRKCLFETGLEGMTTMVKESNDKILQSRTTIESWPQEILLDFIGCAQSRDHLVGFHR